ncbi:MAG: beta-ketoacyl-ACP synthase III [Fusobacteriaceae bacterium]
MKNKSAGIIALGAYVPEKIMTNFDFEKIMDTSDEWIKSRTGIEERRFAAPEQATSDLAVEAAKKALENGGISAEEIELIIVATCTPDYLLTSSACLVQKKLGAINAAAMDLGAACSGLVYALTVANSMVVSGVYKKILVIGAETLSRIIDIEDRNTAVLFGDGAAAAVVGEVEEGYGILSSHLGSDGDINETLIVKAGGSKYPMTEERMKNKENYLKMKGQEVFKFAVNALPNATKEALKKSGLSAENVDIVIPHQANSRIIETASKKLGIPMDKFYLNLNKFGNTSAASIGIAMEEALNKNLIKKGDIVAITGFGGGLTFGSLIMKWAY